jgi:hypothetical protein
MTGTRDRRPLVFLAVLLCHIAIVSFLMRETPRPYASRGVSQSTVLLFLQPSVREPQTLTPPRPATKPPAGVPKVRTATPSVTTDDSIAASPEELPPKIDWDKEAERAADNAITEADKQNAYRNLSALSPQQLTWVRQNQLEPAPSGIPWKYRRVEITDGGLPIIHINDHCVSIPMLMFMVFCKIGHIEPKGDLFDHMKDVPK